VLHRRHVSKRYARSGKLVLVVATPSSGAITLPPTL
jgi:hypothetical protein